MLFRSITIKELPKYPVVKRDLSLLLDSRTTFAEVVEIARRTEKKLLRDVILFDVYEGKNLPQGKKSYAITLYLQDTERTMSEGQIETIMTKIQKNLLESLGAELR